jgi:signal transduction histidine kinase
VIAEVDAAKIEQVVRNLLENAIRYSPTGGVITVGLRADELRCELSVADKGIGIAPEDQPQIFERFYRARDPRVQPIRGTGLGLSICRKIVWAHNGDICVDSALDRGTVFTVRLPLKATGGNGDKS